MSDTDVQREKERDRLVMAEYTKDSFPRPKTPFVAGRSLRARRRCRCTSRTSTPRVKRRGSESLAFPSGSLEPRSVADTYLCGGEQRQCGATEYGQTVHGGGRVNERCGHTRPSLYHGVPRHRRRYRSLVECVIAATARRDLGAVDAERGRHLSTTFFVEIFPNHVPRYRSFSAPNGT